MQHYISMVRYVTIGVISKDDAISQKDDAIRHRGKDLIIEVTYDPRCLRTSSWIEGLLRLYSKTSNALPSHLEIRVSHVFEHHARSKESKLGQH